MITPRLTLTPADETYLQALLAQGTLAVKTHRRAQALLWLHQGQTYGAVAALLDVRYATVSHWATHYRHGGEERLALLHDRPRAGRPVRIDGAQQAKVVALACSPAPDGYGRWSLRLLAQKAVELGYCGHLSKAQAGRVLKKTTFNRSASASGV